MTLELYAKKLHIWLDILKEYPDYAKYQDLVEEASLAGWHAVLFPIEVGARGFPAMSVRRFLQKIGLEPRQLRKAINEIATAAETSSRWRKS